MADTSAATLFEKETSSTPAGNDMSLDGEAMDTDQLPSPEVAIALVESLIFPTNPLMQTYEKIRVPIVLRTSGCWFSGASGEGKSTAAVYCVEALRTEFPLMPAFYLNAHMLPATASRSIPIRLLAEVEHKVLAGDPTKLRIRLARTIAERASQSSLRQCVLVIDEAQTLRIQDLFLLKDISNDLAGYSTGLLTIMFGESPKMEELENRIRSGEDFGLAERFFTRRLTLCPYASEGDWESLLKKMDECRFTELNGSTVPEAFLTDSHGKPYRLANESKRLWKALGRKRNGASTLTLRRIFTGIRWWILNAREPVRSQEPIPKDLWARAMAYAGCVDSD